MDQLNFGEIFITPTQSTIPAQAKINPNTKNSQAPIEQSERPYAEVHWTHGKQLEERHRVIGSKILTEPVMLANHLKPKITYVSTEHIDKINDSNLRYALALEDAARVIGLTRDEETGKITGHKVTVCATGEDGDSTLLAATYSGTIKDGNDSFMQSLHSANPHNSNS